MPPQAPESGDDLRLVVRAVLIADVVDSVRLIDQDQQGAVRRWQQMLNFVIGEVMPAHGGRLVKSLGDGFMLEFVQPRQAVAAAFKIQHAFTDLNAALPPEQRMLLRMGADCGEIMVGNIDVFGTHVNIAARLLTLAGPGEIVVSEDFRDQITDELDAGVDDLGERAPRQVRDVLRAEVEYLGDCILKNLADPVRAYRLGPPGPAPVIEPGSSVHGSLRPTIAVIPFSGPFFFRFAGSTHDAP